MEGSEGTGPLLTWTSTYLSKFFSCQSRYCSHHGVRIASVNGQPRGVGKAGSKKQAKIDAARRVLEMLEGKFDHFYYPNW